MLRADVEVLDDERTSTGLLAGLTRRRVVWSLVPGLVAVAVLWELRAQSGADVVRAASGPTETVLTAALLVTLIARWVILLRAGRLSGRPSARPARAEVIEHSA